MHPAPLLSLLSIASVTAALQTQLKDTEICSTNPLAVPGSQLVCPAPQPKPPTPVLKGKTVLPFIKVEPELWDENDERYIHPSEYKLPPPWEGPEECVTQFCIYANKETADGGMALITTARNAYLAAHFPPAPRLNREIEIEPSAYYEAEVPGKGVGLVANRTIRKGEVIFRRLPTLLIQATPHTDLDPEVREQLYAAALDRLPAPARRKFMRQMGDTVYARAEKNSFRVFVDGDHEHSAHLAIYPDVSRFNHDCRPK